MNDPEKYSKNNQIQKSLAENFFKEDGERLRKKFDGKEIYVLDIGSGCGRILNEVFMTKSGLKLSKVIGVDVSEEMVKFANEKYGNDSMSFYVMDATKEIPENLKDRKFDLVTSFFCLHWITDFNAAFQNVQRFLKPNGIFCCIFTQVPKAAIQAILKSKDDFLTEIFTKLAPSLQLLNDPCEIIEKHLNNNGMKIVYMSDVENDLAFESLEAIKGTFEAFASKLSAVPENEKPKIYEKLFEMLEMRIEDDKFVIKGRVIYFIAKKLPEGRRCIKYHKL